jgi:hypothetical protein
MPDIIKAGDIRPPPRVVSSRLFMVGGEGRQRSFLCRKRSMAMLQTDTRCRIDGDEDLSHD